MDSSSQPSNHVLLPLQCDLSNQIIHKSAVELDNKTTLDKQFIPSLFHDMNNVIDTETFKLPDSLDESSLTYTSLVSRLVSQLKYKKSQLEELASTKIEMQKKLNLELLEVEAFQELIKENKKELFLINEKIDKLVKNEQEEDVLVSLIKENKDPQFLSELKKRIVDFSCKESQMRQNQKISLKNWEQTSCQEIKFDTSLFVNSSLDFEGLLTSTSNCIFATENHSIYSIGLNSKMLSQKIEFKTFSSKLKIRKSMTDLDHFTVYELNNNFLSVFHFKGEVIESTESFVFDVSFKALEVHPMENTLVMVDEQDRISMFDSLQVKL